MLSANGMSKAAGQIDPATFRPKFLKGGTRMSYKRASASTRCLLGTIHVRLNSQATRDRLGPLRTAPSNRPTPCAICYKAELADSLS